jgi:hypothetical protein
MSKIRIYCKYINELTFDINEIIYSRFFYTKKIACRFFIQKKLLVDFLYKKKLKKIYYN